MTRFAILNADNGRVLRDTTGAVATWPTYDAAWSRAFDLIPNYEILEVAA